MFEPLNLCLNYHRCSHLNIDMLTILYTLTSKNTHKIYNNNTIILN